MSDLKFLRPPFFNRCSQRTFKAETTKLKKIVEIYLKKAGQAQAKQRNPTPGGCRYTASSVDIRGDSSITSFGFIQGKIVGMIWFQ